MPVTSHASFFSFVSDLFTGGKEEEAGEVIKNSQNMALLKAIVSPDPASPRGGGDIIIVGGTALLPETGPSGTIADIEEVEASTISIYVVRSGDTLSGIAKMFGVTVSTIVGANSVRGGIIQPGQTLLIFPISGLQYTVAKGDTLESIAKKYRADAKEILAYNILVAEAPLKVGEIIFIPDAELPRAQYTPAPKVRGTGGPAYDGYYLRPILGGRKTHGLHGYNGIDLGTAYGAPVFAAASGNVMLSRNLGWNGGYGKYLVIEHNNGTQTLYAHLSEVVALEGYSVVRGQVIGYVGSTGKSTGSHLHFEVRGARNPF